ncbi:hypothetical protein E2C01_039467 [Portunus trituberculatus]|uniref:Uncharacterized protein n=1 Tax=Portunus trituberculatus TaxID=210409 RepID=A0A5B7FET5_PORTR|nr:hypothetical protein [Portunus trituberculatus]
MEWQGSRCFTLSRPFKSASSMQTRHSVTLAPMDVTSSQAAFIEPVKDTCFTSPGNLPFLRTGTKGTFRAKASGVPKRKPRDSNPTTTSGVGQLA